MNDIIELYSDGLTIEEICEELQYDKEEIIYTLRQMKKKDGKDYSYEFKEMVVERLLSGNVRKGQVVRELGIAYKTVNKYLEKFNAEIPNSQKKQEENMFTEIDWHSFTVCPKCKGVHVNDLNIYHDEGIRQKNSYCLSCGTEWLERNNKVYMVLWEFVR